MSNYRTDSLVFPATGRSVVQIKKDAKKLSKGMTVPYQAALDMQAKKNGLDMPFAQAIEHLLKSRKPAIHPADNATNMQNHNKGTPGTNRQYDQVHGNRSKQLQRITMKVKKGLLNNVFLSENNLQKLCKREVLRIVPLSGDYQVDLEVYDLIQFQKPIKGGKSNISGALQRIRAVMTGRLENKQSATFWIGDFRHIDTKHPSQKDDEFFYCPAIDGYW